MLSESILNAYTRKFRDDFIHLAQQAESRLEATVRTDPNELNGSAGYFDRIGAIEDTEVVSRFSDTKWTHAEHTRRRIILRDFAITQPIDKADMRRMANSQALPMTYLENARRAYNRRKDDIIIQAVSGNAYAVDADLAASAVPLPSAQKIVHGSAGLTKAKLLAALEILHGNEVDEDEEKVCLITAKQLTNLLNITEVTSSDFNTVKALVEGRINEWLGLKFIRTQRLTTDANGHRQILIYPRSAIGLAKGQDFQTDIGPRRDKNNVLQVHVDYSLDATRIEDEKVVEIACVES